MGNFPIGRSHQARILTRLSKYWLTSRLASILKSTSDTEYVENKSVLSKTEGGVKRNPSFVAEVQYDNWIFFQKESNDVQVLK
jgi:hypothetical protein